MNKRLLLLGSGGHSKVLVSILKSQGEEIIGYFDIKEKVNLKEIPYLGTDESILNYDKNEYEIINGIGDIKTRNKLFNFLKERNYSFKSVIHSSAVISDEAIIGEGVQIMPNVIVQTATSIGDNSIINSGVIVEHDCYIESGVHLSPGAVLSGGVSVYKNTHLGTNCTVLPNITIGNNVLVGAGSVVTKNIENQTISWGNPARERRKYE